MTGEARDLKKAAVAHLLRAAAGVTGRDSFMLVGTGAVVAGLRAVPLDLVCLCPDPDDVALSKLCAQREKDREWLETGLRAGVLHLATMRARSGWITNPNAPGAAEVERRLAALG